MQVLNVHKRIINQPIVKIANLLKTLATENDKVWPINNWPRMRFKNKLKLGEVGGHGIIQYRVDELKHGALIVFRFLKPNGFKGIHKFEIEEIDKKNTLVKHIIIMDTVGVFATLKWIFVIRWLHDALIENAFDTIENNFLENKKHTTWNYWVSFWRFILTRIR